MQTAAAIATNMTIAASAILNHGLRAAIANQDVAALSFAVDFVVVAGRLATSAIGETL
jgi:hypothetical protein